MKSQPLAAMVCGLVIAGTAACTGAEERTGEERTIEQEEAAAQALEATDRHKLRSPAKLVLEVARESADLSEEQARALDDLAADLEGESERLLALREELRSSAVTVVRSGTGDAEAFDRSVDEAVRNVEEHVEESLAALEEIHGLLEPEQRAEVAGALRARLDERFGARKIAEKKRDGFQRFALYLVLSPKQTDELLALKKELIGDKRELRPSRDEIYALVDAFEGEDFGAALDTLQEGKSKMLRARVARAGERTDAVLGIFTHQQRELLADLILEGPRKVLLGDAAEEPARL